MKKIYMIRHGESEANVNSQIYFEKTDSEITLTPMGIIQARDSGKLLCNRISPSSSYCIFHSPFKRAIDTAVHINTELFHGGCYYGSLIEEPLIYERSWGDLNNIIGSPEFNRDLHFSFYYRPSRGESFADCYVRVILFFQELYRKRNELPENIIIVSHGEWIRLALKYLRGYSIDYFIENRSNPKNCEIIEIEF